MACDGLPDPGVLFELSTFLYLWCLENEQVTIDKISLHCEIITYVSVFIQIFINCILAYPSYIKITIIQKIIKYIHLVINSQIVHLM